MTVRTLALSAAAGLVASAFAASPATAQGRWVLIGSQSVGFQTERDTVSGRGDGRFRAIRVCVAGAPVQFRDLDVRFGNGQRHADGRLFAILRTGFNIETREDDTLSPNQRR